MEESYFFLCSVQENFCGDVGLHWLAGTVPLQEKVPKILAVPKLAS